MQFTIRNQRLLRRLSTEQQPVEYGCRLIDPRLVGRDQVSLGASQRTCRVNGL